MQVSATTAPAAETAADTVAVGVFDGKAVSHDVGDRALQSLLDSGEARTSFKALAVTHAQGKRWVLVGLGDRDRFDAERARVAAATVEARAAELGARTLCWEVPHGLDDAAVAGLVEGTVLAAYRFDRYKKADDRGRIETLTLSDHEDRAHAAREATVVAEATNAARDLQNAPSNDMTPTRLGERALALAASLDGLEAEVEGPAEIEGRGMGAFAAVARGSYEEPRLITLRYDGPGASAEHAPLGLVGKAVTFDSGGISIKPSAKMHEMKFDMSGGAAVLEAMGAIATLRLPVRVIAVIGATENMPSGRSMRPGDIVRAMNGVTIEVNNTDAEGRLVLADCLAHAVALGAGRIVDLATLTGAIIVALGSTYAGLMGNNDAWAKEVEEAGDRAGELVHRLPLHDEFDELIHGRYADIINAVEPRKAGSITAAQFLKRFVGETPWVHLDIAGTAWDNGRAYAAKGGSGWGVRTLVELARAQG
jgi:leucyl aminopeptidase